MENIIPFCNICNMLNIKKKTRSSDIKIVRVVVFCCDYLIFPSWSLLIFLNFTKECFLTDCFLFVHKRGTQPSARSPDPPLKCWLRQWWPAGPPLSSCLHWLPRWRPPPIPQPIEHRAPHTRVCPRALSQPQVGRPRWHLYLMPQPLQTYHDQNCTPCLLSRLLTPPFQWMSLSSTQARTLSAIPRTPPPSHCQVLSVLPFYLSWNCYVRFHRQTCSENYSGKLPLPLE